MNHNIFSHHKNYFKTNNFKNNSLQPDFFPPLNNKKVECIEIKKSVSYVDKLNKITEEVNNNEYVLRPGWVKITMNNNKIITEKIVHVVSDDFTKSYSDEINCHISGMISRWREYKINYIENYVEDDYEYNHKFPNYDYEYFDKLDEKYDNLNQEEYITDTEYDNI